jgi:hypothetical protein
MAAGALPPWSTRLSSNLRELSNALRRSASARDTARRTQALTAGRTLVRVGRATASGSSSRSSVSSRPTFLRIAIRAALLKTANATTVAAPMPSQNHTGMVILSAFAAAAKPTVSYSRTVLV